MRSSLRSISIKHDRRLFFFVDDNITSNLGNQRFLAGTGECNIRWVSQSSINAAHDEEFLTLMVRSGCQGVLIGFESLNAANLEAMNKSFNTMRGGFERALANLRRHKIRVYGTFVFGYDADTPDVFEETARFAVDSDFYIAAFNHLTPFPGTPLYQRLQAEGRLQSEAWWLDPAYRYNQVPFEPCRSAPTISAKAAFARGICSIRGGAFCVGVSQNLIAPIGECGAHSFQSTGCTAPIPRCETFIPWEMRRGKARCSPPTNSAASHRSVSLSLGLA